MPRILAIAVVAVLVAYPFIVYFSLNYFEPAFLGLLLAGVFAVRLAVIHRTMGRQVFIEQLMPLGGALVLLVFSGLFNSQFGLRLTPVFINLGLLCLFAYTLIKPPSMIERFARLTYDELPAYVEAYTRKVTFVWCGFFVFNSLASFYTAKYTSMEIWTLYNGCIAYLIVAVLFGFEYLVRLWVRSRQTASTGKS